MNKLGKRWWISGSGTDSNIEGGIDIFEQKFCKGLIRVIWYEKVWLFTRLGR